MFSVNQRSSEQPSTKTVSSSSSDTNQESIQQEYIPNLLRILSSLLEEKTELHHQYQAQVQHLQNVIQRQALIIHSFTTNQPNQQHIYSSTKFPNYQPNTLSEGITPSQEKNTFVTISIQNQRSPLKEITTSRNSLNKEIKKTSKENQEKVKCCKFERRKTFGLVNGYKANKQKQCNENERNPLKPHRSNLLNENKALQVGYISLSKLKLYKHGIH